ncbi:MAG: hemerythrin domain-containing protein [Marinilabiliales bacterium]|nr:hemerythrin domain-containing protein [Marinilabiliales bacterium]
MKSATQNLENDHVHILQLIDVMRSMAAQSAINPDHLEEACQLVRLFADGLHHNKEENLLFPFMAEKGFAPHVGPVAVMLAEHDAGRAYIQTITRLLPEYRNGDLSLHRQICVAMEGYADLLTQHISKENNVLFRMADQVLSAEDQHSLLVEFGVIDDGLTAGTASHDYIQRINALLALYGADSSQKPH